MSFDIKQIFTAFMILFAVIDIIGNIPVIIDLRKKAGHIESGKASIIAGVIMIVFLFVGERLLGFLGVDVYAFAVAGSLIIFFIALEMILGITLYKDDEDKALNASVFPIAFPLIAGPGSLTTLLSLRAEVEYQNILIGILMNVILIFIVLKTSSKIEKVIGQNGITIIRKIFGVVLLAISVKMFASNIMGMASTFGTETAYRKNVYVVLKQKLGPSFTKTKPEFIELLDTDVDYGDKVYKILKDSLGEDFQKTKEEFREKIYHNGDPKTLDKKLNQ